MANEGDWVTTVSEVADFAAENDGECIVASVQFFSDGEYAPCVFRSADSMRAMGYGGNWDYFFCDEPECFDHEQFGLEDK